jgi:hypothetical protein
MKKPAKKRTKKEVPASPVVPDAVTAPTTALETSPVPSPLPDPALAAAPPPSSAPVPEPVSSAAPSAPVMSTPPAQVSEPVITFPTPEEGLGEKTTPEDSPAPAPSPLPDPALAAAQPPEPTTPPQATPVAQELPQSEPEEKVHVTPLVEEEKEDLKVPSADLHAPLPSVGSGEIQDEVMIKAKQEWKRGIVFLTLFLVLSGGVVYGYYRYSLKQEPVASLAPALPSPTPAPTRSPSAAAVTEVKPRIAVWNGSGVAGAAGALAAKLNDSGYRVSETKNAPEEQAGTTLFLSSELRDQEAELVADLESLGVSITTVEVLESSEDYDARIVLGQ